MDSGPPPEAFIGIVFMCIWAVIALGIAAVAVVAFWKICSKAGYPGALGLLALVPLANFILILYLAFARWPILDELDAYRAGGAPARGGPASGGPGVPPAPPTDPWSS
jgi:hypothetical protein